MATITVSARGATKSVESPYTDSQAFVRLCKHVDSGALRSMFAADLARKGLRYPLSEKQLAWVHVLVCEHEAPKVETETVSLAEIRRVLIQARDNGLKRPSIRFDGLKLSLSGDQSSRPGTVFISDGRPYGSSTPFGRIELNGELTRFGAMTDETLQLLLAFNADPAVVGASYGRRTGNCCFCSRELSKAESLAVGYGPICAGKYGLPWGE